MPKQPIPFSECVELLKKADYGCLAMSMYGTPYVLPLNYVYHDSEKIYFHTGHEGRKIDYLSFNPQVCFNINGIEKKIISTKPCSYTYTYWSVNVFGTAHFIQDKEKIKAVLNMFVAKYGEGEVEPIPEEKLEQVNIIEVEFKEVFGMRNQELSEGQ